MTCNHTLHAHDEHGRLTGSWTHKETEHGVRVVCRECGRLYGQLGTADLQKKMRAAYIQQQRRRGCPGCGEEPFLG